ncbi:oligosaccharide flippase family protein [Flavobacterium sandaracinum]|uniref:O-antigen translocase n=1 Tax=Flavobacterium sandaracinum TaxID=2541733 RepID=A0A4R5CTN4_9FLAO|nr:oligosaccharide flippase family protein [Flavobacterium sandaracinum]TDE02281.1 O-antigen translocase [Flavobacterium sandaracinum]
MADTKTSYHQILKTTSLFGGVQLFTIFIAIIRTKLIAVFVGPAGMGIIALLNSAIGIIGGFSGLGIETSAVKHISADYKNEDLNTVSVTVSVVKKVALVTGIIGSVLTLLFSNWLSLITFGNTDQMHSFMLLSLVLLFRQLTVAELAILQGLRKMRFLAKANLYGNIFGLLLSVPLYYFYGIDAIVPTIIGISLSALFFSFYYSKKVVIEKRNVTKPQLMIEGKRIVKLGFMLTISGLLTLLTTYLIQIYVGKQGGLEQVGFYNAGFTLLNSYVGIIFTVMSTDYFPRLASISNQNELVRTSVSQQSFLSILIITPIIILFLTLIPLIVKVVFTPVFTTIIPMVCFGILAMLFRAVSWSMGYILIAKGDSKMFLKTAIGFNAVSLLLNVLGYYFYGLEGLGFSFLVYYVIHFFGLKIITRKRYGFYFDSDFYQIYLICILMCLATFLFRYIPIPILKYSAMAIMAVLSIVFVLFQMNKKMALKEFFNALIKKKND